MEKIKYFLLLITILLTAAVPQQLNAQWNTNTSVNLDLANLVVADIVSVPTSDGKTWIAFYHENAGNYDMRAQLLDANGNKLLGSNGVLVSNQASGTATFVFNACVDNNNNLVIGCQDQRTGTMQAVVYKISQAGTHLWSSNGVILGAGMVPNPAALSNNDVAVTWNDDASNTLKIQKITAAGTLAWASPVTVTVGASTTTRGQIVANTNEKFTMVYQKNAGGISTNLYAQMYNNAGTALYAPLQICNQTTAPYRYYSIAAVGDTTYFGYFSSTGLRFNSFVQRINPGGTIPWGMNGSAFNTHTLSTDNYQMETSIAVDPSSSYIWAVSSFTDPNQTNYGVYVQKFLRSTGARQFSDFAKVVYPVNASRNIVAGSIALIDDTPMFATYESNYKIYATRLNASGDFSWPGNRVELSSTTAGAGNPKGRYGFTPIGPTRCASIWTEDRGSGSHGYAQGITPGGLIGIDVATQGAVPATITTSAGTLQLTATVFPATANQAVTWSIIPVTGFASISASGLVTGISDGTVWGKAISQQDPTLADSLLITLSGQIPLPPSVITLAASNIGLNTATINGSINANNYISNASFQWGLTASYGNTATANPAQVSGNSPTLVLASLSGLNPGTTYHFRCVGSNTAGTTNGMDLTFTTTCLLPGTLGNISGPASPCAGSTGNVYTVNAIAGASNYVWTVPTGATITAGNNTNSITVSYSPTAVPGEMSVYASNGTCLSQPSNILAVNVLPLPIQAGPIDGPQVVCEGENGVQYSINPVPGANDYVWTVPQGAVIASGLHTTTITVNYTPGSVSGTITVYAVGNCGTGATSNPITISVNPLPATPGAISGPDHVCKPATGLQYSVGPVTNAFGYNWTFPAGVEITAGANTNQVTVNFTAAAVSGSVSVTGTNGNCLGQSSPLLNITVNPTPNAPVITQHHDTLISNAPAGNQWYRNGTAIPGAVSDHYVFTQNGIYTVIVTLNGCSSTVSNTITIQNVNVEKGLPSESLNIYPNPSSGKLTIKLDSRTAGCQLEVLDMNARTVYTQLVSDSLSDIQLDLGHLPRGTYVVVLVHNNQAIARQKVTLK